MNKYMSTHLDYSLHQITIIDDQTGTVSLLPTTKKQYYHDPLETKQKIKPKIRQLKCTHSALVTEMKPSILLLVTLLANQREVSLAYHPFA